MTTAYKRISESVEDLLAKSHYMVVKSQADGNLTFDGHSKSLEELDNESRCRSLCARIERALQTCREEEIPELLDRYDLLYRIGYGKQPDSRYMATQRQRVYTAWRSGNRNIQESQIYRLLKKCTNASKNLGNVKSGNIDKTTDSTRSANARTLLNHMLRNWVRTLSKHSYFPNVTAHENYQRLAIVMRENIDSLIESDSLQLQLVCGKTTKVLKREWYEANRVTELSTLNTPLMKSYRSLISSLFPHVFTWGEYQESSTAILTELLLRSDLSHYDREAFETNLTYALISV